MMKILIFLSFFCSIQAILYDRYYGTIMSTEEIERRTKENTTSLCTIEIEACDPEEGRRLDGSCNNLNKPTTGAYCTPYRRLLPGEYGEGYDEPRKSVCGCDLPLPRSVRTDILLTGSSSSPLITQLSLSCMLFLASEIVSQHDTVYYLKEKQYCCTEEGKADTECIPIRIPDDDPVHRFSGIRCLNLTRPKSFQSYGCIGKDIDPARIVLSTPAFDLASIYGYSEPKLQKYRTLKEGRLKTETDEDGKIWPPSSTAENNGCSLNQGPSETRCHDTPNAVTNSLGPINMVSVWFWRLHNAIADELFKQNPCWSDEKLFLTARDINIAVLQQISLYELFPILFGEQNLLRAGVISLSTGFRDLYDPSVDLKLSMECPYALRYFHILQEGNLKMYDTDGYYVSQMPIGNLTFRTGFLGNGKNMDYLTQGSFRQPSGSVNYAADPIMTDQALGSNQLVSDVPTNDLTKGRYLGFQSYAAYRKFLYGESINCWEDLHHAIDSERVELLKNKYETPEDVDLLAGLWLETPKSGALVPDMVCQFMIDQLLILIKGDRFWFENQNRPNAPDQPQLAEIRKSSIARILCTVGDSVTRIQLHAFLRISPENPLLDCSEIPKLDFSAWKDSTCEQKQTACPY